PGQVDLRGAAVRFNEPVPRTVRSHRPRVVTLVRPGRRGSATTGWTEEIGNAETPGGGVRDGVGRAARGRRRGHDGGSGHPPGRSGSARGRPARPAGPPA